MSVHPFSKAARKLKGPYRTSYEWFASFPIFKTEFDTAADQALLAFKDEAVLSAVHGENKPVNEGCKKFGTVKEYSDTLMIVLLKARSTEKYKERVHQVHSGKGSKALFVRESLKNLTKEEWANLSVWLKKLRLDPLKLVELGLAVDRC